ncbi:T-lymphocyte activation antigen CD80 isoform X2 [Brienomyrus brachyistius]|uniref:T-lymphocyte activation antigen CD80 isoform X2 n=1 Tax=Brienomyrus brachyistius TaxID=42636 RepID=UPI0020B372D8|nr:T-lymphocyte activation antigen CD80 isoform X2 [Brienomyrus brachyistius]
MAPRNLYYTCQMMLIVFVPLAANTGSSDPVVEIHVEVGGTAKFTCPNNRRSDLEFMYLQKDVGTTSIFVNGFHAQKPVETAYKNRSDVSSENRHVILRDLSPADEGVYDCIVRTKIDSLTSRIKYRLTITANYSQPQVMEIHNDSRCIITCSSSGGYPLAKMVMVLVPDLYQPVMDKHIRDPDTELFSVFGSITLNISQPLSVTCTMGNRSSAPQDVCQRIPPSQPDSIIIVIACVLVTVLFIVALAVVLQRRRCSCSRSQAATYSAAQRK